MKTVKKITFGLACVGLFILNYQVFYRYFGFCNVLLFSVLAIVAAMLQLLLFMTARNLIGVYKQKAAEGGSTIILRLFAKGLDYLIALFILLLSGLLLTCLPRVGFFGVPVICAALYLFLCDSVTKSGSLGKKIFGLQLTMTDQTKKRCPLYASAVRNFYPALFAILMVELSGKESRYNVVLNWLFLAVFIVALLDIIYLKKTGVRFLDQKLGLMVRKVSGRKQSH